VGLVLLAGMKALITDIKTALHSAESNCWCRIKEWKAIFHLGVGKGKDNRRENCEKNIAVGHCILSMRADQSVRSFLAISHI